MQKSRDFQNIKMVASTAHEWFFSALEYRYKPFIIFGGALLFMSLFIFGVGFIFGESLLNTSIAWKLTGAGMRSPYEPSIWRYKFGYFWSGYGILLSLLRSGLSILLAGSFKEHRITLVAGISLLALIFPMLGSFLNFNLFLITQPQPWWSGYSIMITIIVSLSTFLTGLLLEFYIILIASKKFLGYHAGQSIIFWLFPHLVFFTILTIMSVL